jgi:hypothetical protein
LKKLAKARNSVPVPYNVLKTGSLIFSFHRYITLTVRDSRKVEKMYLKKFAKAPNWTTQRSEDIKMFFSK